MRSAIEQSSLPSLPNSFVDDIRIAGAAPVPLLETPAVRAMRRASFVGQDTPVEAVPELLLTGTRLLVVVDDQHRPCGVVTAAHILRAAKNRSKENLAQARVRDISTPCSSLRDSATLRTAAKMFASRSKTHAAVINAEGCVVGILTASDVLRALGA